MSRTKTRQVLKTIGATASRQVVAVLSLTVALAGSVTAQTYVQVPYAGVAAGIASGSSATVCSTALDSVGDGCPATEATVSSLVQAVWNDKFGNIYVGDYNNHLLRVIYHGGAVAASLITTNNPSLTGSPQVGYIYAIGGGRTTAFTAVYCSGSSGPKVSDNAGSNCPAYQAYVVPVDGDVDADGDVIIRDNSLGQMIRIIYAGGAAAANIIKLDAGVTAPVIGSIYRIGDTSSGSSGYDGDGGLASSAHFRNPHSLALDSDNNIYIADTSNNVVRRIDPATGYVNIFAGGSSSGCTVTANVKTCAAGSSGDNGPAAAAALNGPYEVATDKYGNVYIADSGNLKIRVVYEGGTIPGLSNLTVGDIYTFAGGGTGTASGTAALSLKLTLPRGVSLDSEGNVYITDYSGNKIWRVDAKTAMATVYAGGGAATTVGAACGTTGQKAVDKIGSGCPGPLAVVTTPFSRLAFDENNVGYVAEVTPAVVGSFTFNEHFAATNVGSTSTLPLTMTATASFAAPTASATGDFTATPVNCTAGTSYAAGTLCTYTVQFAPTLPGLRIGDVQQTAGSTTITSSGFDGTGVGPLLGIAPAATTSFGSSITTPAAVTSDESGNLYVSDTSTGTLWKGTAGGSFVALLSGLNAPAQSAVDGLGNIYVADSGNNQIVEHTATGTTTSIVTGLSSPSGLLAMGNGVLYIADTGNNRILRYNAGQLVALDVTGLSGPKALAMDGSQTLYIADTGNSRIVTFTSGGVQGTISTGSQTFTPAGIAVDPADDLYIADKTSGSVYMLPNGSLATTVVAAGLSSPSGIGLDGSGRLFFADSAAPGIQEYDQQQSVLAFPKTQMQEGSTTLTATITDLGNATLNFTSPAYTVTGDSADFSITTGNSGCGNAPVASGANCTLSAAFTPVSTGNYSASLAFASDAANTSAATVALTGTGVDLVTTQTGMTLVSPSSGSVTYSQTAVFNVTVTPSSILSTGAPTGQVTVLLDGSQFSTIALSGSSVQISLNLPAGTHTLSAAYSGDDYYSSSHDDYTLVVLQQPTRTVLTYTTSFTATTSRLTLTATVSPTLTGSPTGQVAFYNGSTLLGTTTLSAQGVATYATTTTTYPAYTFSAVYQGDSDFLTSTSSNTTVSADFSVVPSDTALTVVAGYPATTQISLASYFTYNGTLSFSCSNLPQNTVCRFSPQTVALTPGSSAVESVELFTDASVGVQSQTSGFTSPWMVTGVVCGLLLLFLRGRKTRKLFGGLLSVAILALGVMLGASGCGNKSTTYNSTTTPPGTSTITVTVQDTAGHSHAINYALTVLGTLQ